MSSCATGKTDCVMPVAGAALRSIAMVVGFLSISRESWTIGSGMVAEKKSVCRFAGRCPFADVRCRSQAPPLVRIADGHLTRCWKAPLEALVA